MKKFIGIMVLILWAAWCIKTTIADNSFTAPYGFSISTPTTTSLIIAYSDSNDITADSTSIIDASDSTFYAYLTASPTTITGLKPHTSYDWFIKTERGDTTHVSNKDTMFTLYPELENRRTVSAFREMWGARSYEDSSVTFDSLYVSTSTGLDSTMAYWSSSYTSIQAKGIGVADSTLVNLLVFYGNTRPSRAVDYDVTNDDPDALWAFDDTHSETISITTPGWTAPTQLVIPPSRHFYIRADGQTDNGFTTKLLLRVYRYGELAK